MPSAAERLASNLDFGLLAKATELKKRLLFVMGALIVYRIGTYIPIPGIDPVMLQQIFARQAKGVLGIFNMFSGGALGRMTIFALAIFPYISASWIMQLASFTSPTLQAMKKEGEAGRRKINQYTRYGTVLLAGIQAYGIAVGLEHSSAGSAVLNPGLFFRITTVVSLTGGTMFLMWLGEQMTARGVGNGTSLIIFTGIVAGLPGALAGLFELGRRGAMDTATILVIMVFVLAVIAFIVFVERAQRRIVVQYPKRQMGNKMFAGDSSHLPLKLNTAGVMPPIFASSILSFPAIIAGWNFGSTGASSWLTTIASHLQHGTPSYIILFAVVIIAFSFFMTSVMFNPDEKAEDLKKNGGFIPGKRPGKQTAAYLDYVLTRLTTVGAIYMALVCCVPELLMAKFQVPFYLGGTSLLIVVNVTMDFVGQIQSHLFAHQYEGLIKKARLKGRR